MCQDNGVTRTFWFIVRITKYVKLIHSSFDSLITNYVQSYVSNNIQTNKMFRILVFLRYILNLAGQYRMLKLLGFSGIGCNLSTTGSRLSYPLAMCLAVAKYSD